MRASLLLLCLLSACLSQRTQDYLDGLHCTTGTENTDGSSSGSTSGDETTGPDGPASMTGTTSQAEGTTETGGTETGSSSGETTGATTGVPGPVCGNGVIEDGDVPEECDDGNTIPDDGCSATCASDVLAFVTSLEYQGGDLGVLWQADSECANLAFDAGLPEPLRFKAWLSNSMESAGERIVRGRGRIVMVNGLEVAASWDALLAGTLTTALTVTEKSQTYTGGVWTGTNPDGSTAQGADHCEDWTNSSPVHTGFWGRADALDTSWTFSDFGNPIPCGVDYAIYCFQEP